MAVDRSWRLVTVHTARHDATELSRLVASRRVRQWNWARRTYTVCWRCQRSCSSLRSRCCRDAERRRRCEARAVVCPTTDPSPSSRATNTHTDAVLCYTCRTQRGLCVCVQLYVRRDPLQSSRAYDNTHTVRLLVINGDGEH